MVLKIVIILNILLQGNTKIPLPSPPSNPNTEFIPNFKLSITRYDREQCASIV